MWAIMNISSNASLAAVASVIVNVIQFITQMKRQSIMSFPIGTKERKIIMDDFIVGPQCEEIEEEFEMDKRSFLELLDDFLQGDC